MGQTHSAPSSTVLASPPLSRRSKKDAIFRPSADTPAMSPVWRDAPAPRRRLLLRRKSRQRILQQLEQAARDQQAVARSLADSRPTTLVLRDDVYGSDEHGELEGLMIRVGGREVSRSDPVPDLHDALDALHERFDLPGLGSATSSSSARQPSLDGDRHPGSTPSIPLCAPSSNDAIETLLSPSSFSSDSPAMDSTTPASHWSESSASELTPPLPFRSFRDSLNLSLTLHRYSAHFTPTLPVGNDSSSNSVVPFDAAPVRSHARLGGLLRGNDEGMKAKKARAKKKGTIVVIGAERMGSGRYSMMRAAERAAAMRSSPSSIESTSRCSNHGAEGLRNDRRAQTKERESATNEATVTVGRKMSFTSGATLLDVCDSHVPFTHVGGSPEAMAPENAISSRFSTTPVFLPIPFVMHEERNVPNRTSWIQLDSPRTASHRRSPPPDLQLASCIAASPEIALTAANDQITRRAATTPSPPLSTPFPARVASRFPAGHPAKHHTRFASVSSASSALAAPCAPCAASAPHAIGHSPQQSAACRRHSSIHSSTPPSTASFLSSRTSDSSIELPLASPLSVPDIDFTSATCNNKLSKEIDGSPALSSGNNSIATFMLDELIAGNHGKPWSAVITSLSVDTADAAPSMPVRSICRLSLEQPDLPLLYLSHPPPPALPRSPVAFNDFSLAPSRSSAPRKLAFTVSPTSHPLTSGLFDSPPLSLDTPDNLTPHAPVDSGIDFPDSSPFFGGGSPRFSPSPPTFAIDPLPSTTATRDLLWMRASAGDAIHPVSSAFDGAGPLLEDRRGTFPSWMPPSQRRPNLNDEGGLFEALVRKATAAAAGDEVRGREGRLGSVEKRGFSNGEIRDWMVQSRRESEEYCV
ncbi:hypothetical protein JCM1840_006153 [Sporobolomyces johnsonii]